LRELWFASFRRLAAGRADDDGICNSNCRLTKLAFGRLGGIAAMDPQTIENMRKKPAQARSEQTVATIIEATAQVLEREGEAALTTNRLAERAGFSIGTLYQYFPNKDSILRLLAERERARVESAVAAVVRDPDAAGLEPVLRAVIAIAIGSFGNRVQLRRVLLLRFFKSDLAASVRQTIDSIGRLIAEAVARHGGAEMRPLSEARAYVLTRAITGAIRAAVLEGSPLLHSDEFKEELVRLALAYLRS
jgi:AcrR family transcriptional regulator